MAWVLTRGLTTWRNEINSAFPGRDKESDGSVGDLGHQVGISGHNPDKTGRAEYKDGDSKDEVRAIDVDKDLRNPKFTMEQLIQWLVSLGRAGVYLPWRYFIYNGRIWRKATGWATQAYHGPNPHDHHAHFSGDFTEKADEWTGFLGLVAYVKKMTTKPAPVKVNMIKISGDVPELKKGMNDPVSGANYVKRVQALLNWLLPGETPITVDGDYGKLTAAGIKTVMAGYKDKTTTDGSKVGLPEWRRLYGI